MPATLSGGRAGWCVIFRHPVCRATNGQEKLRVRRGLGTRDEAIARNRVAQLNEILGNEDYWCIAAKEQALVRFDPIVVNAFYDHLQPTIADPWEERGKLIPLPPTGNDGGYRCVQLIGATGAGKTTVVRQLLGTDPKRERFPSTSAARTTTFDMEFVLADDEYQAAVSFHSRDYVQQHVADCVVAAVASAASQGSDREILRRLMEHSEQRFRLNYILGNPETQPEVTTGLSDGHNDASSEEGGEVSTEERQRNSDAIAEYLRQIKVLAAGHVADIQGGIEELPATDLTPTDALEDAVDRTLREKESFNQIVDRIMEDIESRFALLPVGEIRRGRDGWPATWQYQTSRRDEFLLAVNRFSSNYAMNFGRLLAPVVQGVRVRGPFQPRWCKGEIPRLVILDGQGIGHVADTSTSIPTAITRRFDLADVIVLVDNAAQPMQAASCATIQSLVASGYEAKLVLCFTHFESVTGDNLPNMDSRISHVQGAVYNAAQAVGTALRNRDVPTRLTRHLMADGVGRILYLSEINLPLADTNSLTAEGFRRLLDVIGERRHLRAIPSNTPSYNIGALDFAIQRAVAEFHTKWRGAFGFGGATGCRAEHWARVKALTRRVGVLRRDEYQELRPVADLIRFLQEQIGDFLDKPSAWEPFMPPSDELKQEIVEGFKNEVFSRLHSLARRRLLDDHLQEWLEAYWLRGVGSTDKRRKELLELYSSAAPVPNQMPESLTQSFLAEIRRMVGESLVLHGGELRGWTATDEQQAKYWEYVAWMRSIGREPTHTLEMWLRHYLECARRREAAAR